MPPPPGSVMTPLQHHIVNQVTDLVDRAGRDDEQAVYLLETMYAGLCPALLARKFYEENERLRAERKAERA